ncbi:MAG: Zn-ribbon domain-containing OB-fold protein [Deltaproteobacteria bacterium]|nr:Zn-ribbon domain-containing OB-fold protein [Deltaproteobacteria bacterium]MBI3390395.1 Zn-ribbon domain-containing OB-fold protein [Deltaproteobacteria bacterium]
MAEKKYAKPLPRIDEESKGFWEACQRHELRVQKCHDCGAFRYYPRALCPHCLSDRTEWVLSSGRGTVYTFTVTHQNQAPGFRDALPYVMAYVELDEGVRMLTNIVDCDPAQVKIGMPVQVIFEDVTPEVTIPKFKPL